MSFTLQFVAASLVAMFINIATIPYLISLAERYEWYDIIDDRKIHSGKIPRIGGIGIFLSFFVTILLFFTGQLFFLKNLSGYINAFLNGFWALFIGAIAISIVGLLDDFKNLRPLYKLLVQIILAVFIISTDHYFKSIYIPFADITVTNALLGKAITFVWIIGIANGVNLIDGMDGLSSGVTGIAAFFMGLTAFASGNFNQAVIVFILFGSLSGFLIYNFPPAKLFMGDSGSLFIGFVLAVLPLYSLIRDITPYTLILSISFLFVPIIDTLAAIVRRKIKGVPFHSPDKEHIHHKLLRIGLSAKQILAIAYSVTFILSLTSYIFSITGNPRIIELLVVLWAVFIALFVLLSAKIRKLEKNNQP